MTVTVRRRERQGEERFGPAGGSLWYIATADASEDTADARAAVASAAPATFDGFDSAGVEATKLYRHGTKAAWLVEVQYGAGAGFAALGLTALAGFSGQLAAEKMTKSLSVVGSGASGGGSAPDRDGLILVDEEGKPEGTEVLRPVFTPTWTANLAATDVENTHVDAWIAALGTVNAATWKGYPAGTLLFQGLSSEQNDDGRYRVRIEMGYRPIETNVAVGDGMTIASLAGWDFLEIVAGYDFDAVNGLLIAIPDFYYVHRIYPRATFGDLGV